MENELGLKRITYNLIHRNPKNIQVQADEIGISANLLYKYGNPSESGADLPAKRVPVLTNVTRDYAIIEYLCSLCNGVFVKLPSLYKIKIAKGEVNDFVALIQDSSLKVQTSIKEYFEKPNRETYQAVITAIDKYLQTGMSVKKRIEKNHSGQFDLFQGDKNEQED